MGTTTGKVLIKIGQWWLEERKDFQGNSEGSYVKHDNCSANTFFSAIETGKCWRCYKKMPDEIAALWILHNNAAKRGDPQRGPTR